LGIGLISAFPNLLSLTEAFLMPEIYDSVLPRGSVDR
jgi:ABC-type protease/lipase transport system fused ATPase/permease subunit